MELYNLEDDPRESLDVASQHPDIVERMWKHIEASHAPVPGGNPNFELEITYP